MRQLITSNKHLGIAMVTLKRTTSQDAGYHIWSSAHAWSALFLSRVPSCRNVEVKRRWGQAPIYSCEKILVLSSFPFMISSLPSLPPSFLRSSVMTFLASLTKLTWRQWQSSHATCQSHLFAPLVPSSAAPQVWAGLAKPCSKMGSSRPGVVLPSF